MKIFKPKTSPPAADGTKPKSNRVLNIIGIILLVILVPFLIINVTLIIRSYTNPDEVPSIGGVAPMIVLTDSMDPLFRGGDLIFTRTVEPQNVKVGDVITFFDPASSSNSVVTHRVIEIVGEGESLSFITKGDANNTADTTPVPAGKIIGTYATRIPGMGNAAMFMKTTQGLIICVVIPFMLLVGIDLLRRRRYDRKKKDDTAALRAELEALKKEKGVE